MEAALKQPIPHLVHRQEVPSRHLWPEREISLGLITGVSWLTARSREHIECGDVVGHRLIGKSIE